MAELICKDLTLGYSGDILVSGLSFEVNAGDYLCIVGENGSGKSTLMRTILGLQPPLSGSVEFGEGLRSTEIGYLPQQTQAQRDFPASVREIVISGFQGGRGLRFFYSREEKRAAYDNMKRLGIDTIAKKCYRELSGGQQQRVLLARALCATKRILLLDEPVSGLDPHATAEMYSVIKELNADGIAIVMISHDIEAAAGYADHILHIGESVFFGTTEEYKKAPIGRRYLSTGEGAANA